MSQTNLRGIPMQRHARLVKAAVIAVSLVLFAAVANAQEPGQKTFATSQDAGKALYEAVKSGDKAAMELVLGQSSASIISSGDEVQDKNNLEFFTQRFERMNRWAKEANGSQILYIGAENWPFPIPLKNNVGQWYFDSKAGVQEILFRSDESLGQRGKREPDSLHRRRKLAVPHPAQEQRRPMVFRQQGRSARNPLPSYRQE